jgi:nucleoside-diphosphate-sugar epimerase
LILVTGAGGFVGSSLCRRLLAQGERVAGLWHRDHRRLNQIVEFSGFHLVQGDIREPESWLRTLPEPVDTVLHLATQPPTPGDASLSMGEADAERTTNVEGTAALLQAMAAHVDRWIVTSSMSVYDFLRPQYLPVDEAHPTAPQQAYGYEKLRAEELFSAAADRGLRSISLRLAGLFGPGREAGVVSAFLRRALEGEPIEIPTNRGVDILHVEDAVTALCLAYECLDTVCPQPGHRLLNIGRGQEITLEQLAQLACVSADRQVEIHNKGTGDTFYMDISAAIDDLGFAPSPLAQGLDDVVSWMRSGEEVVV